MKYEEFVEFVKNECLYEAVYKDSEGRSILVINMLDAFTMLNKATGRLKPHGWRGLIEEDFSAINQSCLTKMQAATSAESILKEKNT
jgi:hypothetical protein